MKTILLAAAAIMALSNTAHSQDTKYAKDYKVCRTDTGYEVCPDQSTTNLNDPAPKYIRRNGLPPWKQNSYISPANVGKTHETGNVPTREGLENSFPQKDQLQEQNNRRNLNSGNNRPLSPSTGEIR